MSSRILVGGNRRGNTPVGRARATSRTGREREAKAYWDSLTPEQEAWALRKTGFFKMGASDLSRRPGRR
jgi:hypothetical protein